MAGPPLLCSAPPPSSSQSVSRRRKGRRPSERAGQSLLQREPGKEETDAPEAADEKCPTTKRNKILEIRLALQSDWRLEEAIGAGGANETYPTTSRVFVYLFILDEEIRRTHATSHRQLSRAPTQPAGPDRQPIGTRPRVRLPEQCPRHRDSPHPQIHGAPRTQNRRDRTSNGSGWMDGWMDGC